MITDEDNIKIQKKIYLEEIKLLVTYQARFLHLWNIIIVLQLELLENGEVKKYY